MRGVAGGKGGRGERRERGQREREITVVYMTVPPGCLGQNSLPMESCLVSRPFHYGAYAL